MEIILISHGFFAREALASAEMIVGKQEGCFAVSVTEDKSVEKVEEELREIYNGMQKEKVLILCDIFGGTPSNVAVRFLMGHPEVQVVSGFNLPMLLDIFLGRHLSLKEISTKVKEMYPDTIVDINAAVEEQNTSQPESAEMIEL